MSRFFLDPRTAQATWTILMILGVIALAYAVRGVLLLMGAGIVVGPCLSTEVSSLAQKLPEMSTQIQSGQFVELVLQRRGWEWREIAEIERLARTHMGQIIGYAQQATAALLKWLAGAWVIVLIPVLAFFILKDAEQFTAATIARLS